ncbi:hypothetical protein D3C77_546440 [compost metagenome]
MLVPQRAPADREVDHGGLEERHRYLAGGLDDGQAVDLVGTAPPGKINVGDVPAVVSHVGKFVVEVIAYQHRQAQMQDQQQQGNAQ